jgi:hypothetical protein
MLACSFPANALHARLAGLPWRKIPVMDRTRDHGHGRVEVRTLKVAAVAGLYFPHAAQGIQATRRVRASGSRRWRTVTVYAITSLALGTASQPAQSCHRRVAPGHPNLAAALRHTGRDPARPLTILGLAHA